LPRETLDEIERAVATLETLEQYLALLAAVEYLDRVDNDHPLSAPGGRAHGERLAWVLESAFFDAMCTDFMAPVMRGVLTYSLDRGDALARFWAERYEWRGSTNVAGYARRGELKSAVDYDESTPLLILNATDVGAGTRLAIGFPPLHDTLAHGSLAEARGGRSLSEVDETFAIDLSHAVKLSACFPWGFSVSRLRLEQSAARGDRDPDGARSPDSIRVLDGGVVDNTGIDSIYLIFKSLEELAAGRSGGDSDQKLAREILASLREKGVVIVEVDSGAKPVERELAWYSGPVAPIQGLSNAGHTNADRAKRFYIREVQRIVRESLSHDIRAIAPDDPMPEVCELEMAPNVVLHVPLQCNHYKPGEETPQSDVMTAWALGPFDKAEIVGRFLIEVALWDDTRRVISARLSTFLAWHAESSERLLGLARARLWGEVAKANAEPSGDAEGAREPTTKKLFEESTLQMDPSASASGWLQKDPEVERLWRSATDTAQSGRTLLERLKEAKPDEKERLERELATTRRVAQEQLKKLAEAVEERAQTASPPPTAQTDAKLLEYRLRVRERTARENFGSPKAAR
ncbi:MAG TPA: hypothetical protein VK116_11340, partial [Planctomycetota bacterium]|nr:hypothetical protein [Planctomycetota bacterium]